MGKILRHEEIDINKNQHVEYSGAYEVKFWIQEGDYWKQKTEMYFAKTKGEHEYVINRWKSDYRRHNIEYVSVCYH